MKFCRSQRWERKTRRIRASLCRSRQSRDRLRGVFLRRCQRALRHQESRRKQCEPFPPAIAAAPPSASEDSFVSKGVRLLLASQAGAAPIRPAGCPATTRSAGRPPILSSRRDATSHHGGQPWDGRQTRRGSWGDVFGTNRSRTERSRATGQSPAPFFLRGRAARPKLVAKRIGSISVTKCLWIVRVLHGRSGD